jgi:4-amino-4-deoxy-L-arabinose transferase-like glycosyltransferase
LGTLHNQKRSRPSCGVLQRVGRLLLAHPDASLLVLLAIVAAIPRLILLLDAPIFYNSDSPGYLEPAYNLASGQEFAPRLKRPIAYQLLLAAILAGTGPHLAAVAAAQHCFGVLSVGLTYLLGRSCFNRWVGAGAGILLAISGPQLAYEHTPIPESLFIVLLLTLALTLIVMARDGPLLRPRRSADSPSAAEPLGVRLRTAERSYRTSLLLGGLIGLASLVKPVAQTLLPLALGLTLVRGASPRRRLRSAAFLAVAFAIAVAPWMFRNLAVHGRFTLGGSLGDSLLARTVDHSRGRFVFDGPGLPAESDPVRNTARRLIQAGVNGGASSGTIRDRIRAELGLTEDETDRLLQELAVETIRRQPLVFLGSIPESLSSLYLEDEGSPAARADHQRAWSRLTTLGSLAQSSPTTRADQRDRAIALLDLYRPAQFGLLLPLAALVGLALRWRRPATGGLEPTAIVGILAILMVLAHVILNGPVPRYRYMVEPFVSVLALGAAWSVSRSIFHVPRVRPRGT